MSTLKRGYATVSGKTTDASEEKSDSVSDTDSEVDMTQPTEEPPKKQSKKVPTKSEPAEQLMLTAGEEQKLVCNSCKVKPPVSVDSLCRDCAIATPRPAWTQCPRCRDYHRLDLICENPQCIRRNDLTAEEVREGFKYLKDQKNNDVIREVMFLDRSGHGLCSVCECVTFLGLETMCAECAANCATRNTNNANSTAAAAATATPQ